MAGGGENDGITAALSELLFSYLTERANELNHLVDLAVIQLLSERRHVAVSVVIDFVDLRIRLLLNFFRAKIGGLQLFAQRGVSGPVRPVAKLAFVFEDGRSWAAFRVGKRTAHKKAS